MSRLPLLSVCLITYNHANYIEQAIASILNQKVDFDWEIIIADDCSTDGTTEIISRFSQKNPELIRLIVQKSNVGPAKNWHQLIAAAKGRYIAYMEGDDYWSDTHKLTKQVTFLESHSEYVGCFHNTEERFEGSTRSSFLYCNFPEARSIAFSDMVYGNLIPSCSMLYRNNLFREFPAWFDTLKMGDWPLHLLNAQFGDYWYMPQVMGVHRLHTESTWMLQDADRNNKFIEDAYDIMIKGFADSKENVEKLIEGKERFIQSLQRANGKVGIKQRSKDLIIRMIKRI